MTSCPNCRSEVSDSARFCESCGASLTSASQHHDSYLHQVRALVLGGQKIEAIKVYREATGVGLAEAKSAVEAIERGKILGADPSNDDADEELIRLLREGNKIEAIKRHREQTRCGLKEAKDFVEAFAVKRGINIPQKGCLGVVLAVLISLCFASVCVARADEATFTVGTKTEEGWITHQVESPWQAKTTQLRVLLPDSINQIRRYPVVYVLPVEAGRESKYGDGLTEVRRCNLHSKHGLICVAPTFAHLPWYADHPADKKIQQESYFVKQIVPYIDRTYPTADTREGRWLLGFSKSGWGAWSLIARHPDLFGRAAAWDAPLNMQRFDLYGAGAIFGTQEHFETYRLLPALKNCQTLKTSAARLVLTGYDNFREHHETAHQQLDESKLPHVYRDGPKRKHVWDSGWVEEAVELLIGLDPD